MDAGDAIRLDTATGLSVWTPASLKCVTTYVLLEQGAWFEREMDFVVRYLSEGMTAIDIGANLGMYALAMARKVGPSGAVQAFEPGEQPRSLLERSKIENGLGNLSISPLAVSDQEDERRFYVYAGSEYNSFTPISRDDALPSEIVQVTSVDAFLSSASWTKLDFLKIDAEGEETRILEGAINSLRDHSPLIMFEATHEGQFLYELPESIAALGYQRYRLTAGGSLLRPLDMADHDAFTVNLFAAKPDRAEDLAARGLLVQQPIAPQINDPGFTATWSRIAALPYSAIFGATSKPSNEIYLSALCAYFFWSDRNNPLEARYGALCFALQTLEGLCRYGPSAARLNTLARAASEGGRQDVALNALERLTYGVEALPAGEPFIIANPRFDAIAPGSDPGSWYMAAVVEQLEFVGRLSSCINPSNPRILRWLRSSQFANPQIVRRLLLQAAREGETDLAYLETLKRESGPLNAHALEPSQLVKMAAR